MKKGMTILSAIAGIDFGHTQFSSLSSPSQHLHARHVDHCTTRGESMHAMAMPLLLLQFDRLPPQAMDRQQHQHQQQCHLFMQACCNTLITAISAKMSTKDDLQKRSLFE